MKLEKGKLYIATHRLMAEKRTKAKPGSRDIPGELISFDKPRIVMYIESKESKHAFCYHHLIIDDVIVWLSEFDLSFEELVESPEHDGSLKREEEPVQSKTSRGYTQNLT